MTLTLAIAVVVAATGFAFVNGFHDASNSIATSIATRALTPRVALGLAAVMNLVGAVIGREVADSVRVAESVSAVVASPEGDTGLLLVLAALVGATAWNLATWWAGLPSSSTHALIGGLMGAAVGAGTTVHWDLLVDDVVVPMIASPLIGFVGAFAVMIAIMWLLRRANPQRVDRSFRMLQTVSAAAIALGHGLLDAQRTMGLLFIALVAGGYAATDDSMPIWVVALVATAISLGTYAGGWRIIETLGRRLVEVDPARGFSAEAVGAGVLYTSAFVFHVPISTTHTITSAVAGAGATKRFTAVRWGLARTILAAWLLTVPLTLAAAWLVYELLALVLPVG